MASRRLAQRVIGGCAALFVAVAPAFAPAQPAATDERAVLLFKEARALMEKGQYPEACPKLEESLRIDPGMGTLYNLSDCYEHIGRTASAWSGFRDVAAAAEAAGQGPRARAARERALGIEPKLSRMRLIVSKEAASAPGIRVQRDGIEVGPLLWGTDVPVDPGSHTVGATAVGMDPWSTTVTVDQPGNVVTVTIPALSAAPSSTPAPTVTVTAQPPPPPPPGKSAAPAVVLGVIGLGAVGAGVGLILASSSKEDEAARIRGTIVTGTDGRDDECLATPAPAGCAELKQAVSSADVMKAISIGAFVVGSVSLVGAAIYLMIPAKAPSPARTTGFDVRFTPALGPGFGGVAARGVF